MATLKDNMLSLIQTATGLTTFSGYGSIENQNLMNYGIVPYCLLVQNTSQFTSEATDSGGVGGNREVTYTLLIVTNSFANRREANLTFFRQKLHDIMHTLGEEFDEQVMTITDNGVTIQSGYQINTITIVAVNTFDTTGN